MQQPTPILLLASERSGTNLLRAIMSSHSAVASPPPCGVVGALANSSFRYVLPSPHYDELIADAIKLTQAHMNRWDVVPTVEEVREQTNPASFWSIFRAINEIYAKGKGCQYWFSKEPELFRHVFEMALHMPDAKFVYLVRDGRDVASSILKSGILEYHIYNAARRWADNQKSCLSALSDPLISHRIFMLKYEELIVNPEQVCRRLMEFIGLDFEQAQLEFYANKEIVEHSKKSLAWKNLVNPIDSSNKKNYKKSLNTREIEIFESVAWNEMVALGYPLESRRRREVSMLSKGYFMIVAVLRRKLRELSIKDENKRRKVLYRVIKDIANRSFNK